MAETDRRVRRTRRALQEAFVALVVEQGYEKTTVQHVLDRADIGRSTFYAHYRDLEALFTSCFDGLREGLHRDLAAMAPGRPLPDPVAPVRVLFEHAAAHRDVSRAVCGRPGGTVASRHLHTMVSDLLREHFAAVGTRLPAEVMAEYFAAALLGVLIWWVRHDFPHDADHVAAMCQDLTAPGVLANLAG
jgi:AcrR family transcriptional regulator